MAVRERRVGHPAVVPTPPELGAVANPERGGRGRSPGRGADDAPRIPPLCRTTSGSAVAHGRSHRGACCVGNVPYKSTHSGNQVLQAL